MKILKNNYGLCSEGSVWELTREMTYELWIFFFQWNLFYHNSLWNVILCILKRMRINLITHPPLFIIYLFIYIQKKTPGYLVQLIQGNYHMTSKKMWQNNMLRIFALCVQCFKVGVNAILLNETMIKAYRTFLLFKMF